MHYVLTSLTITLIISICPFPSPFIISHSRNRIRPINAIQIVVLGVIQYPVCVHKCFKSILNAFICWLSYDGNIVRHRAGNIQHQDDIQRFRVGGDHLSGDISVHGKLIGAVAIIRNRL